MKKYLFLLVFIIPFFVHADASTTVPLGEFCGIYAPLVEQYNWNPVTALYVMNAESGCLPLAVNLKDAHGDCRGSYGLFQIGCETSTSTDPVKNVAAAYALYQKRSWQPWAVCVNGRVVCE